MMNEDGDALRTHINRVLSDRIYWLVNQADYRASNPSRRSGHIFASLVFLKNHVDSASKTPDDYCAEYELQANDNEPRCAGQCGSLGVHSPDGEKPM